MCAHSQSSNLDSPLFAILMLFGLLQTRESAEGTEETVSLSAPFIPLVRACARSRVWKVGCCLGIHARDRSVDSVLL